MNKWRVEPENWQYLPRKQQKRLFKTGYRMAGVIMVALITFSLMLEAILGL